MASSVMASVSLKPTPFTVQKSPVKGLPSISRPFRVVASGIKKIKTDTPYGKLINYLISTFFRLITCIIDYGYFINYTIYNNL